MSKECQPTIATYKDQLTIIDMPKKGGTGLSDALAHLCQLAKMKASHEAISDFVRQHCY